MKKNVLAIVAHPDDEAIGCGGALIKHQQQGDAITIIYMTDGVSARGNNSTESSSRNKMADKIGRYLNAKQHFFNFPDNQMDQTPLLNIIKSIESVTEKIAPDIIYTHHICDLNVDHRIVHQAVLTAFRPFPNTKPVAIYAFEVNSSTEWNTPNSANAFIPTSFIDISKQINNKIELPEIYQTEMHNYPHSRSIESIEALAKVRGSSVGVSFAEAFMLIRELK